MEQLKNMIVKIKKNRLEKVDEKIILLAIVGNLEAVKNGGITIDEAEKFMFSPHMINKLRGKMCDEKIVELIMKGCELEDIASLIPEKLNDAINELEKESVNLMKKYDELNESFWIEE